jgi:hypothetical protein
MSKIKCNHSARVLAERTTSCAAPLLGRGRIRRPSPRYSRSCGRPPRRKIRVAVLKQGPGTRAPIPVSLRPQDADLYALEAADAHDLGRDGRNYTSPVSPSSSLSSFSLARICSAINPESCRIAASILAEISGFSLRNALAFSRPCPRRWPS